MNISTGSMKSWGSKLSVHLQGNSINVWVNSLNPHLFSHSIWPKPIRCQCKCFPKSVMKAYLIFILEPTRTFPTLSHLTPLIVSTTIMRPSPLVSVSSHNHAHPTGDELTRQVPHCSELQFAFFEITFWLHCVL